MTNLFRHSALNLTARKGNGWRSRPIVFIDSVMIRFLCRFVGLCLLATAFVLFVYDGTKSIANHDLLYTRLDDVWAIIDQNSLNAVQDWLKQKLSWAWEPYLQRGFDLPGWVAVGIVATILILLGRKRKPLIGYARD